MKIDSLIKKLDLDEFINSFASFFARSKNIIIEGDINVHYKLISELQNYELKPLKKVKNLDEELLKIKKQGIIKLEQIYEFIKIIEYFYYLKKINFENKLAQWIEKIVIPQELIEYLNFFDEKGNLKSGVSKDLDLVKNQIYKTNQNIKENLIKLINTKKLQPYLVDNQVHLVGDEQTLLLRAGFNHFLKGKIVSRSAAGFFYVVPESINKLKSHLLDLQNLESEIIYKIEKQISNNFFKFYKFLNFLNKEFDRLDHYLARINFAKSSDLNFILPTKTNEQKIVEFCHPALSDPKPLTLDFSKQVIIFTGVNAGGKTMALKSILSAIFLSKYLIPYKASTKSKIGFYKEIIAILDDPQNVKNDISTFAGRMVEFSTLFKKENILVAVDEIELGTDANEAAALFKAIILDLVKKNQKIIITTHHKRLASLLAKYDFVELQAAIYDEANQKPTYSFLKGTIGKSYALETAIRYNIPLNTINKAKEILGNDSFKLEKLIEKSTILEQEYQQKLAILDEKIKKEENLIYSLKKEKDKLNEELKEAKKRLEAEYKKAIDLAKEAAKSKDTKKIHRLLNKANNEFKKIKKEVDYTNYDFRVGERVKYNNTLGTITKIDGKKAYFESDDGIKVRVNLKDLKPTIAPKIKKDIQIKVEKPKQVSLKLDLHGLTSEEALEELEKFISDALLTGLNEVIIYHGIGSGRLSKVVKEFLKKHPKVINFSDAPAKMGGFGAKIVYL